MTKVFECLGIKGSKYIFNQADQNKDGVIRVHEFISWLTKQDPKCILSEDVTDGKGSISATVTNTNLTVKKKFYFEFTRCENIEFSEGKTVTVGLEPGEQRTVKLLTVTGQPYHYSHEVACRSEYAGLEDDPNAFKDPDFPHDGSSTCGHSKEYLADVWVRARMLGDPQESVLFDQIRPQDVKQGQVGDCWLMAAIASAASHPELVKKLFTTRHLTDDGDWAVAFWSTGPKLLRVGKAFAKFCYGWGKMQGGDSWFALQAMSGFKSFVGWTARDQKWKKKTLKEDWAHGKTENARGRKINYKCVLVSNGSH
ncbi:Calpain-15 (Small optic lobes homolog) [Durusdinium trenchii]|uniref:Calpain-15 (Small optic lobes homolog) n=1 Tax=Durusdinium trenchii TaxID=1381693 RepID=A0ABP0J135_9DINO